ncbi:pre-mRNA-splicing factor cwc2-like [Panicum virgatum]|uniref:pre-mRNA-splicing factor cwc2-like n=1 Tax=Panicum virgatum TaxID=38727 RepID=UPI0019D6733D|nr:pre-mRNA-splicing factor cwc2-like [Panicum virgatum]
MANKIRFSPVRSMLAHWQKMITGKSPIDKTPLVTHVARYVMAMEGTEVTFLPETEAYRYEYDVSNVFIHLGLDYQLSQPYQLYQQYQPPEQENNDDEEENNNNDEEDKDDDEEDPDEGKQDSDEED